jgi:hypothetical protein
MNSGKRAVPLILGFIALSGADAVVYGVPAFGPEHCITGTIAGLCVAYLGFLLYFFLMPRPGERRISFFRSYLPAAAVRYIVMLGIFCALIFWLNMEALSVLLGAFAGMMALTVVTLIKMRQHTTITSEK